MSVCILAFAASTARVAASVVVVLWPSKATELHAQPDSVIAPMPDESMGVKTGTEYRWPGVRMDFACGECDLSQFRRIAVAVSNTTDKTVVVNLSVKDCAAKGRKPGGKVELAPHAAGEICADLRNMPWTLDAPLALVGMRGFPKAPGDGSAFDPRRVRSFHIFVNQKGAREGFCVLKVTAMNPDGGLKTLSADGFLPFVDKYGQFMYDDWPGKIHDDGELEASRKAEDVWLKGHPSPIPDADRFGGWAGGPQLKATGRFRTEKIDGRWWLVDPDGHLFFSLGVNAVRPDLPTGTSGREDYFSWLPAKGDTNFGKFCGKSWSAAAHGFYRESANVPFKTFDFAGANAFRKYGGDWSAGFAARSLSRIRAWGLNTVASWSDAALRRTHSIPYTILLKTSGTPRLEGSKGWWGALPDPFRTEFEQTLRARAREIASEMRDDPWCLGVFVDNELSWNDDDRMGEIAERYFSTVRRVLKEELPGHLYLGSRLAWGGDDVWRAASRHCDVVSVNIYGKTPNRDLPEGSDDKPMLVSEFHVGATDRGMFHPGLVAADGQAERAECYRRYVEACLGHPRYVGAHWFQWQDQPLTGRPDGENYAIGLVSITDAPHPELVQAVRTTAADMYRRRSSANLTVNNSIRKEQQ